MGWFGGSPSKVSTISEVPEKPETPQYLEDLPPKFEDSESAPIGNNSPTYRDALSTVKLSDFAPSNLVTIPCFRDAMLTGFSAMAVLGVVTLGIRKDTSKAINWAFGGFFLGNIVGWEQCRSLRKKSFQNVEMARQRNQERNLKSLTKSQEEDGLEKWEELKKKS